MAESHQRQAVTPMLAVRGAAQALEFYKQAFGAVELFRLEDGDKIGHAQIRIGTAEIMLADEYPEHNASPSQLGGTSVILHLYVEDVDAVAAQAVAAGAELVRPVEDQFYGDRSGKLRDPFGHVWLIATPVEVVSIEEMQRRLAG